MDEDWPWKRGGSQWAGSVWDGLNDWVCCCDGGEAQRGQEPGRVSMP